MQQQLNRDYVFLSDGDQSVSTIKWYTSTIAKKNNKNKTKRILVKHRRSWKFATKKNSTSYLRS